MKSSKVLFLWPPQPMFYGSVFKHITHVGETIDYCQRCTSAQIDFLDAGVEMYALKDLAKHFLNYQYLIIYCETYTIEMSIKMARLAKQVNPDIKIMGFGKACCYMPNYYLQSSYYDAIVPNGDWEKPIADFINNTPKNESGLYQTLDGIYGNLYRLHPNEWGVPAIDKLPIERYFKLTGKRQLEICVNKGCPHNCSFCSEKFVYGKKESRRSITSIISYIEKTHSICTQYYFDATTFTYDKVWVKNLCHALIELPYKVKWCSVTRLDELTEELIILMAQSGCFRLSIGVETLNSNIQKSINKKIDSSLLFNTIDLMNKYGIRPRLLLIIGLPNQTKEDVLYTYNILKTKDVDIRFKEYAPYNDMLNDNASMEIIRKFDRTIIGDEETNSMGLDIETYAKLVFLDKGR